MDIFKWLEKWYSSKCDGEWENFYGIKINTLDNPGWIVQIDITQTGLEDKVFSTIDFDNNEEDWLHCRVQDGKYEGFGDNSKLITILEIFMTWVEK